LFTVCPKCTLTLVVTTVDLRAGQGYVRCGRCANVFNALIALREGDPANGIADSANRRLQETAPQAPLNPALGSGVAFEAEPEPEPEPQPEPEPEFAEEIVLESPPSEEASMEFDAAATDVSEIFISPSEAEQTGSGTYEAVVLGEEPAAPEANELAEESAADDISHTDTIASEDWSLLDDEPHTGAPEADAESVIEESPLPADEAEGAALAEDAAIDDTMTSEAATQGDPAWVNEMFAEAVADAERARTAEHVTLSQEIAADDDDAPVVRAARASMGSDSPTDTVLEPLLTEPPSQRPSWHFSAGVGALSVLLLLQILHANRQDLVLNQTFGPMVSKVYGWFGARLAPRWDLTAYSVKQLGAEATDSEGTQLRVRLSLHNESDRVQPLPLVRLTLKDRFDNAVATRDLEPVEYLPRAVADQRLLEPDQRIDAEVRVVDPGRAAVGFEIDACLRADDGGVGCANDARRRSAG
jgi:predicted Zn finger-like uncharacterized protein